MLFAELSYISYVVLGNASTINNLRKLSFDTFFEQNLK